MSNQPSVFERFGSGPEVVLFLHGWNQNASSLAPLAEILSDRSEGGLTCLTVDLPGFGSSEAPDSVWGTREYAEWLRKRIEEGGFSKVSLVGHSFGGKIAVYLSAHSPDLVRKLVLIGASGIPVHAGFERRLKRKLLGCLRTLIKTWDKLTGSSYFQSWFVPRFASRDYKNAGAMREILVKAVNENLGADAALVKAPALLIWGDKDDESPLSVGREYNFLIPKSRLCVLPERGHFPFEGAGAHLCATYLYNFLGNGDSR